VIVGREKIATSALLDAAALAATVSLDLLTNVAETPMLAQSFLTSAATE
jgi:hypothetical protein